jgi:hypothetical protein
MAQERRVVTVLFAAGMAAFEALGDVAQIERYEKRRA